MSDDWNPHDTQKLDRLELLRTEREKRDEIARQIKGMSSAVGRLKEQSAALQTETKYLKWLIGILFAALLAVAVRH